MITEGVARLVTAITRRVWRTEGRSWARVHTQRGLRIPMTDGVQLAAERYFPLDRADPPLVLLRTPYGCRLLGTALTARLLAGCGFQVLLVNARGTFDSGGQFDPFRHEREDGLATVRWMQSQAWAPPVFATWGSSYEGYVQWALAAGRPLGHAAAAVQLGSSSMREAFVRPDGVLALGDVLAWTRIIRTQESVARLVLQSYRDARRIARAVQSRPPVEIDVAAFGEPVRHIRDWISHDVDDVWWALTDHRRAATNHLDGPAFHLVAGWHDIYVSSTLADYRALREVKRPVRLVVGPWRHMDVSWNAEVFAEAVNWLHRWLSLPEVSDLAGGESHESELAPVRIYVMGHGAHWMELPDWPDDPLAVQRLWLIANGSLQEHAHDGPPGQFVVNPDNPAPAVGGRIAFDRRSGARDNRALETRSDVLIYTTQPLDAPLQVVGTPRVKLLVDSTADSADYFVRLCDVAPDGKSINICDALARVDTREGLRDVQFALSPTAYTYGQGHRVRVQVSGGAHPRWAPNPSSYTTSGKTIRAEQRLHHGLNGSWVELPLFPAILPDLYEEQNTKSVP